METSMVERSRLLCWDTLYIAVKENTTKTIVKNDVFRLVFWYFYLKSKVNICNITTKKNIFIEKY